MNENSIKALNIDIEFVSSGFMAFTDHTQEKQNKNPKSKIKKNLKPQTNQKTPQNFFGILSQVQGLPELYAKVNERVAYRKHENSCVLTPVVHAELKNFTSVINMYKISAFNPTLISKFA